MRSLLLSFFIAFLLLLKFGITVTNATNIDLATPSNWNIRFDGSSGQFLGTGAKLVDLDNNGRADLIIPAAASSFNSRSSSGSIYIIYDSLLQSLSGTGNTINLSLSSNYSIRIDGSSANDFLGYFGQIATGDIDSDSKTDLVISAPTESYNSRGSSGSVFIIYNSLLNTFRGTGINIDLASSSNYNLRFDGEVANCNFGYMSQDIQNGDFDSDGKTDLAVGSSCDFNSRANSGSFYLIYNNTFSALSGTGNNIDLSVSGKYNLRIDGAVASDRIGGVNNTTNGVSVVDINRNGISDLIVGADGTDYNSRSASGSYYLFYDSLIRTYSGTGNIVDISDTSKFNIRFDGAALNYNLSQGTVKVVDFNQDSYQDIFFSDSSTDINSVDSGSLYYIDSSIFKDLTGTANTIDLATTTNFTFRVDGPANQTLGLVTRTAYADFDNNGTIDIFIPNYFADNNGRANSGSAYLISNSIVNKSSTGTIYALSNASSFSHRFDGATASDRTEAADIADINLDGSKDFLVTAYAASNNSLSNSGSVFVIYNFPHTISATHTETVGNIATITGNVNADNSTTPISGVEYQLNTDYEQGTWSSCTASDGTFNSLSETFSCRIDIQNTSGEYNIYVRAYDTNNVYTAKSRYLRYQKGEKSISSDIKIISINTPETTVTEGNVKSIVSANTFKYDSKLTVSETPKTTEYKLNGTNYWQIGNKTEVWWKSSFNGAKILSSEIKKPFTLTFIYNTFFLGKNIQENNLKLVYSSDNKNWKVLNSKLDKTKKEISISTKNGGYYMIVRPGNSKQSTIQSVQGVKTDEQTPLSQPESTPPPLNHTSGVQPKKHCFLWFCW